MLTWGPQVQSEAYQGLVLASRGPSESESFTAGQYECEYVHFRILHCFANISVFKIQKGFVAPFLCSADNKQSKPGTHIAICFYTI